ncbi:MAG: RHS repeat-associated core domain-containing protein, partial [Elusimicrobia bacterium]|nr:RHS repeat-associated core domain-containing protein [Elusimicrobiota bacterium]
NSTYTYTHDANGNLTGRANKFDRTAITYAYNPEQKLSEVATPEHKVQYKYDPLGRRIEKTVDGETTRYVYDNEDIVAVLDASNHQTETYTNGPDIDEPLIMSKPDKTNYFYHADALGSIMAITDDSGQTIETYKYKAYGQPTINDAQGQPINTSAVGNTRMFTAREYDSEVGLYNYRARYYDWRRGAFIQEDPIGFFSGGLNLYAYVENKPTNLTDSLGLSPADVEKIKIIFNSTVEQMNKDCKRTRISVLNNLISIIQTIASGRLGKPYLICADQTQEVLDALRKAKDNGQFEDDWTFNEVYQKFPMHYYGLAISKNPNDSVVKLDPFWNSIKEIKK